MLRHNQMWEERARRAHHIGADADIHKDEQLAVEHRHALCEICYRKMQWHLRLRVRWRLLLAPRLRLCLGYLFQIVEAFLELPGTIDTKNY